MKCHNVKLAKFIFCIALFCLQNIIYCNISHERELIPWINSKHQVHTNHTNLQFSKFPFVANIHTVSRSTVMWHALQLYRKVLIGNQWGFQTSFKCPGHCGTVDKIWYCSYKKRSAWEGRRLLTTQFMRLSVLLLSLPLVRTYFDLNNRRRNQNIG